MLRRGKHVEEDGKVWIVAQSVFLTGDHGNKPTQITRWISASSLWNMLDTLFYYLGFNRQLIALPSVRCLRSVIQSVTHSPDLIVFLMVEASVARHWRNEALQCRPSPYSGKSCKSISTFLRSKYSFCTFAFHVLPCLSFSSLSSLFKSTQVCSNQRLWGTINNGVCYLVIYSYHFDITHYPTTHAKSWRSMGLTLWRGWDKKWLWLTDMQLYKCT